MRDHRPRGARRPTITTHPCVADSYHAPSERIAEFSTPNGKGGLISVRQLDDGTAIVSVYRIDPGVIVTSPATDAARAMLAALRRIAGDLQAIRDHDAEMDAAERAPTGDDYNVIHDHALDALRSLPEIIAQAQAAGITSDAP